MAFNVEEYVQKRQAELSGGTQKPSGIAAKFAPSGKDPFEGLSSEQKQEALTFNEDSPWDSNVWEAGEKAFQSSQNVEALGTIVSGAKKFGQNVMQQYKPQIDQTKQAFEPAIQGLQATGQALGQTAQKGAEMFAKPVQESFKDRTGEERIQRIEKWKPYGYESGLKYLDQGMSAEQAAQEAAKELRKNAFGKMSGLGFGKEHDAKVKTMKEYQSTRENDLKEYLTNLQDARGQAEAEKYGVSREFYQTFKTDENLLAGAAEVVREKTGLSEENLIDVFSSRITRENALEKLQGGKYGELSPEQKYVIDKALEKTPRTLRGMSGLSPKGAIQAANDLQENFGLFVDKQAKKIPVMGSPLAEFMKTGVSAGTGLLRGGARAYDGDVIGGSFEALGSAIKTMSPAAYFANTGKNITEPMALKVGKDIRDATKDAPAPLRIASAGLATAIETSPSFAEMMVNARVVGNVLKAPQGSINGLLGSSNVAMQNTGKLLQFMQGSGRFTGTSLIMQSQDGGQVDVPKAIYDGMVLQTSSILSGGIGKVIEKAGGGKLFQGAGSVATAFSSNLGEEIAITGKLDEESIENAVSDTIKQLAVEVGTNPQAMREIRDVAAKALNKTPEYIDQMINSKGVQRAGGIISEGIQKGIDIGKQGAIQAIEGAKSIIQPTEKGLEKKSEKFIKQASDVYSRALNLTKSQRTTLAFEYAKKYDFKDKDFVLPEFLARNEIPIDISADKKIDTTRAVQEISQKVQEPIDRLNETLSSRTTKDFNLQNYKQKAIEKLDSMRTKGEISSKEFETRKSYIDEYMNAEIGRYGANVDGETANNIKRGLWSEGYSNMKPNSDVTARIIGNLIKDDIETKYKDVEDIKELNKQIARFNTTASILKDMNGRALAEGNKLTTTLARLGGLIAGGGTGGIAGAAAGAYLGGKAQEYYASPERLTKKAIKLAEKAKYYESKLEALRGKTSNTQIQTIKTQLENLKSQEETPQSKFEMDKIENKILQLSRGEVQKLLPAAQNLLPESNSSMNTQSASPMMSETTKAIPQEKTPQVSTKEGEMSNIEEKGSTKNTQYRSTHQIDTKNASPISEIGESKLNEYIDEFKRQYGYPSLKSKEVNKLKSIINNPESDIKIYRASPVNELNEGDWVTIDKTYANDIKKQNGGKVYEYTVKAKDLLYPNTIEGFKELPSLNKWGAFQFMKNQPTKQPEMSNEVNTDPIMKQADEIVSKAKTEQEAIDEFVEKEKEKILDKYDDMAIKDIKSLRHDLHSTKSSEIFNSEHSNSEKLIKNSEEIAEEIEKLNITGKEKEVAKKIRKYTDSPEEIPSDIDREFDDYTDEEWDDYTYNSYGKINEIKEDINNIVEEYLGEIDEKWDNYELDDISDMRGGATFKPSGFARARSILGEGSNNTARERRYETKIPQLEQIIKDKWKAKNKKS